MDFLLVNYLQVVEFVLLMAIIFREKIVLTPKRIVFALLVIVSFYTIVTMKGIEMEGVLNVLACGVVLFIVIQDVWYKKLLDFAMAYSLIWFIRLFIDEAYYVYIFAKSPEENLYDYFTYLYLNLILCVALILTLIVRIYFKNKYSIYISVKIKVIVLVFSLLLGYILPKFTITIRTEWGLTIYPIIGLVVTTVYLLLLMISFIYSLIHNNRKREEVIQLENKVVDSISGYYDLSRKNQEEIRIMKHDLKNHLNTIYTLISTNKYDQVREYITDLNIETIEGVSRIINTGNELMDAVLLERSEFAGKHDVNIIVKGTMDSYAPMTEYDFCNLISNLLTNAIEYSAENDYHDISVEIIQDESALVIKIINPLSDEYRLEEAIKCTGKGDKANHGLGLTSAHNIVSKYNGEFDIYREDSNCIARVVIFN